MENLLPNEIVLDIFSRIPSESILRCRQVCKTWRALLCNDSDNSNFADMHLCRQILQRDNDAPKFHNHFDVAAVASKVGFVSFVQIDCKSSSRKKGEEIRDEDLGYLLYYGEYDEKKEQPSYKMLTMINHPPIGSNHIWVGSCNGLICLSVNHNDFYDPSYIYNPITRECCNLPLFKDFRGRRSRTGFGYVFGRMATGFGYSPSKNEYKVVRIYYVYDCDYATNGRVQVYTLGSGTGWRNKGKTTYNFGNSLGVFANGAIHFKKGKKIVAFDLTDEKFRVLPSPSFLNKDTEIDCSFSVLGGCLCIIDHNRETDSINIWSFKKMNKNSSNCDVNKEQVEYESWSWSKEFSIIIVGEGRYLYLYRPFALLENGNVLLWYSSRKTATLE